MRREPHLAKSVCQPFEMMGIAKDSQGAKRAPVSEPAKISTLARSCLSRDLLGKAHVLESSHAGFAPRVCVMFVSGWQLCCAAFAQEESNASGIAPNRSNDEMALLPEIGPGAFDFKRSS